jgi:hypoxanthine phosphoribosyltransferase
MNQHNFAEILKRFAEIEINETFDIVCAIANGGIVPAAIINQRLNADFQAIKINLRDENQQAKYDSPILVEPVKFDCRGKRILLVDDRIKTGSTIRFAKQVLSEAAVIKTFAVNGDADYALFNETCFDFPWLL